MTTLVAQIAVVSGASQGIGEAIVRKLAAKGMKVAACKKGGNTEGASQGIGEAIVRRLAAEGMKVAALARRKELLKSLENELTSKGYTIKGYVCDVQDESSIKSVFQNIDKDFGGVTVLVNNAAVANAAPISDIDLEACKQIINTNLLAVLFCTKEVFDSMKTHNIKDGHIINLNSICGHRNLSLPRLGVYSATKHAITDICDSLRNELSYKKSKIRVTSISPGPVSTPMAWDVFSNANIPYLNAEDVADMIWYAICSPTHVNISEVIMDPI